MVGVQCHSEGCVFAAEKGRLHCARCINGEVPPGYERVQTFKVPHPLEADLVNAPPHYKQHPSGIECIEITRHMNFTLGNAVKYIWRAGLKGDSIEDLEKARWYLDDEIAKLKGEKSNG